jgi:3-deoxy-D-manno-octulosonate 8-phosphate phosphatase (KDO 8-P phosphatase)
MSGEQELKAKLQAVTLLAMDVDGVLTDGGLHFGSDGPEGKRFHVADGLGIQLLLSVGCRVVWISGRESPAVQRRAEELRVSALYQRVQNKSLAIADIVQRWFLKTEQIAYIGDDLNDLPAFSVAGVKFAPANAAAAVKGVADFVTERPGGGGAVREVCDILLHAGGRWEEAVGAYLSELLRQTSLAPPAL